MTFDVDGFLAEREGHEASCPIVMKARLADEISRLQKERRQAEKIDEKENRIPEAPRIAEKIEELRAEMEASTRVFRFGEIPRYQYEDLVEDHPPREEDKEAGAAWNAETFPPSLIAAASIDPVLNVEAAVKLWKNLPFGEARRLWVTALAPQTKVGAIPLAVSGIGATPTIGQSSGTAPREVSPAASS